MNESEKDYAAKRGEYISSHLLADFRKSPAIYKAKIDGLIPDEDRPAFVTGRALHCLVLEGRREFELRFRSDSPINPKTEKPYGGTTKKFEEWAEAIKIDGQEPLTPDAAYMIEEMSAAVRSHPVASELLALGKGSAEHVIRSALECRKIQGRLDYVSENGIVDLKSCEDLDWFEADAKRYNYTNQMAFYRHLRASVCSLPISWPVHLVAVEKKTPWRVGVWKITERELDNKHFENVAAIRRLVACEKNDEWPTGYETTRIYGEI